jgi:pyruvate dehydrogenase E2 component (dihydrolipoyllysine-residue acetyltransferase)
MPQLGETVTEGTVTRWLKQVGEPIERDEPLFEVSTDKVDSEVPSPAGGVVSEIRVQEGETVDVGTVLAIVSDGAASPATAQAPVTQAPAPQSPAPQAPAPQSPAPQAPAPAAIPEVPSAPAPAAAPPAAAPAPPAIQAPAARATPSAVGPQQAQPGHVSDNGWDKVLSPVVRRLLNEHSIDPGRISGTGPGGRITRADVLGVIDKAASSPGTPVRTPARSADTVGSSGQAPSTSSVQPVALAGTDEVIPFTNIRRRTAEHMIRSKATSAHTLVVLEADYEGVERTRRAEGTAFREQEGFSLTFLPFIARATVEALLEWPNLNASVGDDALIVHHRINLGIAVDLDHKGLIVPVIHGAEELTLRGMARRIRDLATRARSKQLNADDISGGTFSLTNAGPFGTFLTAPVINQPQIGILSTDGVKRRPVVITAGDGTESIGIHSMGLLCLSWDHRAVDGAYAAAFVARIVEILGARDWSAEL